MVIVYEVTADVEPALCDDYEEYMKATHMPDVLATGAFTSALFERSLLGSRFRMRYFCPNRETLDEYLEEDAPALRADFNSHFSTGVNLVREEWEIIKAFA